MGTEIFILYIYFVIVTLREVKLNNPLMGTEILVDNFVHTIDNSSQLN